MIYGPAMGRLPKVLFKCNICSPRPLEFESLGWGSGVCMFNKNPGDSYAHWSLSTTVIRHFLWLGLIVTTNRSSQLIYFRAQRDLRDHFMQHPHD